MWFLGAGASRAGGIKTARDMIWEFKQKLYCSEKKVALSFIADPGEPIVIPLAKTGESTSTARCRRENRPTATSP
jgi:hypothetical protein